MEKLRGFEVAKGYEDKGIHIPVRKTAHSAGYDIEAAEDVLMPKFEPGMKPTLIPTGLKAYCQPDECYLLLNRSSGPKKGFLMANSVGLIDSDYYENPDNDGHFFFAYFNCSDHDIEIKKGDVIGQVVFTKYLVVDNDNATGERKGGFGSTDNK
jgi:dUTP pyrophosphatase